MARKGSILAVHFIAMRFINFDYLIQGENILNVEK
jgi:hypothetical protein